MYLFLAHLKWFEDAYAIKAQPIPAGLFLVALVIVILGLVVLAKLDQLTSDYFTKIQVILRHYRAYVPNVVSICIGMSLILFSLQHQVLTDHFVSFPAQFKSLLLLAQTIVGLLFIVGLFIRWAAVSLVLFLVVVALHSPWLSSIEHLEYLAAAVYLLITGAGYLSLDRLFFRSRRKVNYTLASELFIKLSAVSLVVVALSEKLLDVPLAQEFLAQYHWNFLHIVGISNLGFIVFIGAMELLFGIALLAGIATRFVIVSIAMVMGITAILLGPTEVIGHLYALGLLATVFVESELIFKVTPQSQEVLIVGGGFGGITTALELAKQDLKGTHITLITDKPHFEYHAALYRVVNGFSPLEVCIPLDEIFTGTDVEIIQDTVSSVDLKKKRVLSAGNIHKRYDRLILALGSETSYMNIPGLESIAFGFKTIKEAVYLKQHLHKLLSQSNQAQKKGQYEILVVGGGASGVELAGELAHYTKILARNHGKPTDIFHIELIEAGPRILPIVSDKMGQRIQKRLLKLGVTIKTNTIIIKEDVAKVTTKSSTIDSRTVVWTAGVKPNQLYATIKGLQYDEKSHRVVVNAKRQAKHYNDVFVIGDGAASKYSGMAQTAVFDGRYVARAIAEKSYGIDIKAAKDRPVAYSIPVGTGWAASKFGNWYFYGRSGWFMRKMLDLRFFTHILPLGEAVVALAEQKHLTESCEICARPTNLLQ